MKKFLATIANWGLPLLLVLSFLCGTAYLASLKPAPKPTKPSREPKPPLTAEDAGKSIGRTGHDFGRGVIAGWKETKK